MTIVSTQQFLEVYRTQSNAYKNFNDLQHRQYRDDFGKIDTLTLFEVTSFAIKKQITKLDVFKTEAFGPREKINFDDAVKKETEMRQHFIDELLNKPHIDAYHERLSSIRDAITKFGANAGEFNTLKSLIMRATEVYQLKVDEIISKVDPTWAAFTQFFSDDGPCMERPYIGNGSTPLRKISTTKVKAVEKEIAQLLEHHSTKQECIDFVLSFDLRDTMTTYSRFNDIPFINGPLELISIIRIRCSMAHTNIGTHNDASVTYLNDIFQSFAKNNGLSQDEEARKTSRAEEKLKPEEEEEEEHTSNKPPSRPASLRSKAASFVKSIHSRFTGKGKKEPEGEDIPKYEASDDEADLDGPEPAIPTRRRKGESTEEYRARKDRAFRRKSKWTEHQRRKAEEAEEVDPEEEEDDKGNSSVPTKEKTPEPGPSGTKTPPKVPVVYNDAPTTQRGIEDWVLKSLLQRADSEIKAYRASPTKFIKSQHLIRFNDAGVDPHPMMRSSIQQGDIVIKKTHSDFSKRFILTFGGADNRPIFSPVNDVTWTRMT